MNLRIGIRPAFALAAVAAWGWLSAAEARAGFENVYTSGHADIGVVLEDGDDLYLHYHFGSNAVINGAPLGPGLDDEDYEFDPSSVTVIVPDAAIQTAPTAVPFLGLAAGDSFWNLPQGAPGALPFLGLATEELANEWSSFSFALTGFNQVFGDGQFALWQGGLSTTVFWQTIDGISATDVYNVPVIGSHDHFNWSFTAPGIYELEITASGFNTRLGQTLSDSGTFRFEIGTFSIPDPPPGVIPEPASLAMMGLGACGIVGSILVRRSRSRREEVAEAA